MDKTKDLDENLKSVNKIKAGVFYNVKNGSSFITSKSSSKNLSNSRELAF